MKVHSPLLLLSLAVACASCSSNTNNNSVAQRTPTPDDSATRAARTEEKFQESSDRHGEMRTAARNAVNNFVKSYLLGWAVKGIASQYFDDVNAFSMDADL